MYKSTTATQKLLKLKKRIRVAAGGTSASKTISILLILIDKAQSDTEAKLTSIVSESIPHLKRGAMRDFLDILKNHGYYDETCWNRTDNVYTFETGSQIEFFGADQPDKLRGARRDRLYINECNNIPLSAYNELEVRTREEVWMDFNPTNEFWFYTDILPNEDMDVDFITLTYKDNEALDEQTVKAIESRRTNAQWWRVYGEGQLGEHEGRIYTNWEIVDELDKAAQLERYYVDFGYTNDPTAIGAIYRLNNQFIIDEIMYQKGMSNKQIADVLKNQPRSALCIADSSEPKSIDEIKQYGVTIVGAVKGPDSIRSGVQLVQDKNMAVTKRSVNVIKEYRNYVWKTDREGNSINVPEDLWNHHMDGLRYAIMSMNPNQTRTRVHKPREMLRRKYG